MTTKLAVMALLASATSGAALAQAGTPAPMAAPSNSQGGAPTTGIGDIVVTARKTEEKLQSVPVTVTALTGAALKQQSVHSVADLQFHVPGFVEFPEAQGGAPDFAIRGAKQQGISGSQGGVAVYLDYVPITNNYSIATSTYDMQSVQVLKGPQGTLFGKNTTGGAIIFSPNKPTEKLEGSLSGQYGNYNRVDLTGMLNVPIADGVALRVAGRFVHRDAYIDNVGASGSAGDYDSENNKSLRASLRIKPTERLTNDTVFDIYHQRQHPNMGVYGGAYAPGRICAIYARDCVGGQSQAFIEAATLPRRKVDTGTADNINEGTYWGVSNATTFAATDTFSVRNIFSYRHDQLDDSEENDGVRLPILHVVNHNTRRQYTDELDFIGKLFNDQLSYTVGLFYADDLFHQNSNSSIFGLSSVGGLPSFPFVANGVTRNPSSPSLQINNFATRSKAVFGQANYNIVSQVTLTLGARYNQDQARFNSQQYQGFTDATLTTPRCNILAYADAGELVAPCKVARRRTFNSFTWNASLNFKPDPRTLLYVSAGRGFQAGGFNQQIREAQYREFQPEKVFNIEAGLKKDWRLFDRPIRTNVSVYRATYKDQQRVENGVYSDGLSFIATFNAANATIWGSEVEIDYLPTSRIDLSLAYSYINAKYDSFTTPNVGAFAGNPQDLSGLAIAATPKHTLNGTIGYAIPIGPDGGKLRTSLSGYYRTGVYFQDLVQNPYTFQKGYALLNARVDLIKTLPVDIGVWMNNVTNKTYFLYSNDTRTSLGYTVGFLGAPRTYGIDISLKF